MTASEETGEARRRPGRSSLRRADEASPDAGPRDGRQVLLQQQARALGDPTRFAIFQHVAGSDGPVRVAALSQHFGLNHNAVRQHLAKLCEAKLLVEEQAPRAGPGRPALQYRPSSGVPGTWATQGPYEHLALLLLQVIAHGRTPRQVGADAGREVASSVPAGTASTIDALMADMQRRGFEPRRAAKGGTIEVVFDFCPLAAAATISPAIVCELHRGLAEGLVDGLGDDVRVSDLQVHSPQHAGCRLQLKAARRHRQP